MEEVGMSTEDLKVVLNGEQEAAAKEMVVKWERILPRMILRVLLVEVDDSTRQIIGALLRKCNYKVTAVSDGLKAWEILKEKPHNFDLVLTEVALPSVSGFSLLTMIMGHEICKNIPVIMMSSQDSIGVVFNCMLKGAVDYLIKPVRKNELRNLWQHVWRRHFILSPSSGGGNGCRDMNSAQQKIKAVSENDASSNHSSDYMACVQNNRESSEKGSDALSSCTKPDTEAESAHSQNAQELVQPCRSSSQQFDTKSKKQGNHVKFDDKSKRLASEVNLCNQAVTPTEVNFHEERTCTRVVAGEENVTLASCRDGADIEIETNDYNSKQIDPSREAIDLIGAIDSRPCCRYPDTGGAALRENVSNEAEKLSDVKESTYFAPLWELSLRMTQISGCEDQEIEERQILKHSNVSAFSRYKNKTTRAYFPTPTGFSTEPKEIGGTSHNPPAGDGTGNSSDAPKWATVPLSRNMEDTNSPVVGHGNNGTVFSSPGLGIIPVPVPIRGMPFKGLCTNHGAELRPIFCKQPDPPLRRSSSTNEPEAFPVNSSNQSGQTPETQNSEPNHHSCDHNADQPMYQAGTKQQLGSETAADQKHASVGSSLCTGNRSHLNSGGCGSVCNGGNGNLNASAAGVATAESCNDEGFIGHDCIRVADCRRSTQREAALTKFRLKRKERCFEKKVRYQSRKRLAEQRPRVKGQFVRQAHPDPTAMEIDCYRCDSFST